MKHMITRMNEILCPSLNLINTGKLHINDSYTTFGHEQAVFMVSGNSSTRLAWD